MKRCIECGEPARLNRALDGFEETCSNECALIAWERDSAGLVCVGEVTVEKIHTALSTTGWTVPGGEA